MVEGVGPLHSHVRMHPGGWEAVQGFAGDGAVEMEPTALGHG